MISSNSRPAVLHWRDYWLSPSETFIRDQITSLTRWRPVLVGRRRYDRPLLVPDYAPHDDTVRGRLASRIPATPAVRRRYRELFADPAVGVVHAHFGLDGLSAMGYAAAADKPLVLSMYGMDLTSLPQRSGHVGARYRAGLPALFEQARVVITVSQFLADRAQALGLPSEKVRVLHPGTRMADDPADRDDGPDRAGVLFVGRLVEKKGVADLLEALSRLPEPLRSVRTTIVGYGPLLKPLRAQADRLGLSVDFLGQQPSREVQRLMAEHLVFCAPSQTARDGDAEGLPMVIVEAARSAMAVVTYAHAGIPEAVHHGRTGLVVPERDVAGLSAALAEVLTDPERARALGRAGRETAGVQFRLDRQTEQLERIYDLVSGGS